MGGVQQGLRVDGEVIRALWGSPFIVRGGGDARVDGYGTFRHPFIKTVRHDPRIGGPIACDEKCLWALCESEDGVRMEVSMLANQ